MRLIVSFLLCALMLCSAPLPSAAQVVDFNSIGAPSLVVEPAYPTPGSEFTVRFDDVRSAAQGANIRWFYNNVEVAQDTREVVFVAPEVGQSATVKVLLDVSGRIETYQTVVEPLYFDLIIEPQTHVPEFYPGRALPSVGSQTRVTALLDNGRSLGNDYIYLWRINDTVFGAGPLRGQNAITFPMPQGIEAILSVQVSTLSNVVVAKRTIAIRSVRPEVQWYELNTLYGLETRALTSFNLIGNSAIFRAEPYYLDSVVFNRPDILEWKLDRAKIISNNTNPYEMTLERTGNPGDALLGFQVRSLSQLLQGANKNLQINL